jgi:hypothetical protein
MLTILLHLDDSHIYRFDQNNKEKKMVIKLSCVYIFVLQLIALGLECFF